jgi:hypothetical protein
MYTCSELCPCPMYSVYRNYKGPSKDEIMASFRDANLSLYGRKFGGDMTETEWAEYKAHSYNARIIPIYFNDKNYFENLWQCRSKLERMWDKDSERTGFHKIVS